MHPIDEIMEERCPNLMKSKIFWSFLSPSIYKIFKYKDAKKIVDDIEGKSGFDCFTYLTEFLKSDNQVKNLSNVPKEGPIILAGNHPTGLTDGIVMFDVLKEHRPDYTLYANSDMIKIAKGFQDIIIPVDWNQKNIDWEQFRHDHRLKGFDCAPPVSTAQALCAACFIFPPRTLSQRRRALAKYG